MEEKNHLAKENITGINEYETSPDIPSTQDKEETFHDKEAVKSKDTHENQPTSSPIETTVHGAAIGGHILPGIAGGVGSACIGGAIAGAAIGCTRIVAAASLSDIEEEASSSYSNKKE